MIARDRQCGGTGEYLQASVRNRSDLVLRPVSPGRHALMVGSTTKLRSVRYRFNGSRGEM